MHAVAEYLLHNETDWNNGTIVALGIKDERDLKKWKQRLESWGIEYSEFYEPDIGNQLTAIACVDSGEIFKSLTLI